MAYVTQLEHSRSFTPRPQIAPESGYNQYRGKQSSFWHSIRHFSPGNRICEKLDPDDSYMIVSGWVAEVSTFKEKRSQIVSFQLVGDVVRRTPEVSNRDFVAITSVEIGNAEILRTTGEPHWIRKIFQAERRREDQLFNQLFRLGRLTAEERVLNLLLELKDRLESAGLVKDASYRMPVTQQMLSDSLGLSLVHINRTLQELRRRKLLTLRRGMVSLDDRRRLADIACYEAFEPVESPRPSAQGQEALSRTIPILAACDPGLA